MRAESSQQQRVAGEPLGGAALGAQIGEARQRRRQHVHAAHADGDALARCDREAALLELRARDLQEHGAIPVGVRKDGASRRLVEADTRPLQRAGEHHLFHDAVTQVARR